MKAYASTSASYKPNLWRTAFIKPASPSNARSRIPIKLKKNFQKDENFKELWGRISKKTRYFVTVNSQKLIDGCAQEIAKLNIQSPK